MSNPDIAFYDTSQVQLIEWDMLDKRKYIPLNICSTAAVRALLYPLTVVKTRIQVRQRNVYRGTTQALWSIFKHEGIRGLYSGYLISTFQVFSGLVYTVTYEGTRHFLFRNDLAYNNAIRGSIGGGFASATCLLLVVPSDIVSQHMMVFERHRAGAVVPNTPNVSLVDQRRSGDSLNLRQLLQREPGGRLWWMITREIYRRDGLIGFYRGYPASLLCYAPSSAALWALYIEFSSLFYRIVPNPSQLMAQAMAAPCAGAVVAVVFNSVDLFRANLQVQRDPWIVTIRRLWRDERWRIFTKGLPQRLAIMPMTTLLMLGSYECVKRYSVHSELRPRVHW